MYLQDELARGERLLIRTGTFVGELRKRTYSKVSEEEEPR